MKKLLILSLWVTFGLESWNVFQWTLEQGMTPPPPLSSSSLNDEQATLMERFMEEKRAQLPERIATTDNGMLVYLYPDGKFSFDLPEWYQDEQIVLSESEENEIANLGLITPPPWVFWMDEMTFGAYTEIVFVLALGLVFGLAARLIGLALGLALGLVYGLMYGLVYGLVYGLIELTTKYWHTTKAVAV